MDIARSVIRKHQPEVGEGDIDAVAEMMVRKRVAVRFTPTASCRGTTTSWPAGY